MIAASIDLRNSLLVRDKRMSLTVYRLVVLGALGTGVALFAILAAVPPTQLIPSIAVWARSPTASGNRNRLDVCLGQCCIR
jgi:hypothetical protein